MDSCFNCGEQGHYAASCPHDNPPRPWSTSRHPPRWNPGPRLPAHIQDQINAAGLAACRAAIGGTSATARG